ncbi:MAG: DUF4251 domain-containing protein [Bacteroidales bacterium]|nr:DUF4251 domain-containing protein [Bacteroidales bacterium]
MKSFKTTFLALIATAFVFAGCGAFSQTPQEKEETSNLVTNAIENGDIYIVIDRIQPRSFPQKETLDGYSISIKDGLLKCYLPYIGRADFSFPNEDAIAVDADNVPINVKTTLNPPRRKCDALLEFNFENRYNYEIFYVTIEVYYNGIAYVKVDSQYRDFINYTGHFEQRPAPKEKK